MRWIQIICFFFFSSRRRHTRLQGDWSSDVCSSDLTGDSGERRIDKGAISRAAGDGDFMPGMAAGGGAADALEQRRSGGGGKAGRFGGVRRDGEGGSKLGMFPCDGAVAEVAGCG